MSAYCDCPIEGDSDSEEKRDHDCPEWDGPFHDPEAEFRAQRRERQRQLEMEERIRRHRRIYP